MSGQFVAGPVHAARGPFLELGQGAWESMVGEVRHAFLGARDYARGHDGPGRIVVVSCAAAARPIGGATLEAVAGAFLTTAAQVAAVELAKREITANVVVPALEPDEATVSAVVDFLLGDAAQGVSGAVVAADGGFSITKEGTPSPLLERPAQ
jgi:NAD(P)-dependent dehydrogenase (short-subunit alcohol dehydrogenase family)